MGIIKSLSYAESTEVTDAKCLALSQQGGLPKTPPSPKHQA